ncbi:hypothetical protein D3C80_1973540 [compost metagenome]
MEAALTLFVIFPPPASGTFWFAGFDGACTRLAADRGITSPMQRVNRNAFLHHMCADSVDIPVRQGVDLYEISVRIIFRKRC